MTDDREAVIETNRRFWDLSTPKKMERGSYPLEAFREGQSTLFDHEREEVGAVDGQSLLHLQCNNGLDTLSWAREGAHVTGIDISEESLQVARALADEADLPARFVHCDVYDIDTVLDEQFDVVYTSRGVLVWLPTLADWAAAISRTLTQGGTFYLYDEHPFITLFDEKLDIETDYFDTSPQQFDTAGFGEDEENIQTFHPLSDVVNAILSAGLRIEFLHEFPYDFWRRWEGMVQDENGHWTHPDVDIPMTFSLRALKE